MPRLSAQLLKPRIGQAADRRLVAEELNAVLQSGLTQRDGADFKSARRRRLSHLVNNRNLRATKKPPHLLILGPSRWTRRLFMDLLAAL